MRHPAKLLCAMLMASLMPMAMADAAVAGPREDADAALARGDYTTALSLIRPLAKQGDADAQFNLGAIYEHGRRVPQDYAEAMKWYLLSATQGDPRAQFNLGLMHANGRGVPQNYAEALKWFRKAAEQGHALAQYNLGVMYERGAGVSQDYVLAHTWYNLAAAQFSASENESRDSAVKGRDFVASKMTPAQIAEAQRLAREWKPKPELEPER
jgi:uncharacterized protein